MKTEVEMEDLHKAGIINLLKDRDFKLNKIEIENILNYIQQHKNISEEDIRSSLECIKENIKNGIKIKNIIAQIKSAIKDKWQSEKMKKRLFVKERKLDLIKLNNNSLTISAI